MLLRPWLMLENQHQGQDIWTSNIMYCANGLRLERISTAQNMADHFTKALPKQLFHRHVDFILGHIPPPHSPKFQNFLRVATESAADLARESAAGLLTDSGESYAAAAAKLLAPWEKVLHGYNNFLSPLQRLWH